ncbi:hypothetical protein GQ53DRAFT_56781 [Thozetella sp. PMI_491]|nr:hypothetical protein GQ53DRAFT_56781 [Thozetella sp. PMI_491]
MPSSLALRLIQRNLRGTGATCPQLGTLAMGGRANSSLMGSPSGNALPRVGFIFSRRSNSPCLRWMTASADEGRARFWSKGRNDQRRFFSIRPPEALLLRGLSQGSFPGTKCTTREIATSQKDGCCLTAECVFFFSSCSLFWLLSFLRGRAEEKLGSHSQEGLGLLLDFE